MTDRVANLANRLGLARASLFGADHGGRDSTHEVLLDGPACSFVVSEQEAPNDEREALSWAWSANVPHHVQMEEQSVRVSSWTRPRIVETFQLDEVEQDPVAFFDFLNGARTPKAATIVTTCLDLFRRTRTAVAHSGHDDGLTIDVYLALLAHLMGSAADGISLRSNDALSLLPSSVIDGLEEGFHAGPHMEWLRAWPTLAVRHASGEIFQQAHYELLDVPQPDLFGMQPAVARRRTGGSVHFTPPFLARSISEQAILELGDLSRRQELVLLDIACGSGAFLVEAVRALRRFGFRGKLRVVGRDISATAIEMARFTLAFATHDWPSSLGAEVDLDVADALDADTSVTADLVVMNPPFQSWNRMESDIRRKVKAATRDAPGRLDLSMAFVNLAMARLKDGGVLATVAPAPVWTSDVFGPWRRALRDEAELRFYGNFRNSRLFLGATVNVGVSIMRRSHGTEPIVALDAGAGDQGTSAALRSLRTFRELPDIASTKGGDWTLRRRDDASQSVDTGTFFVPERRLTTISSAVVKCTVADLFHVKQGIRVGNRGILEIKEADFMRLPDPERRFFRTAITGSMIDDGQITGRVILFYPYLNGRSTFRTEAELEAGCPVFFRDHLEPNKTALAGRKTATARWWELSEPRLASFASGPLLISKYFAGPRSFVAAEMDGELVVQGFGWVPTERLKGHVKRDGPDRHCDLTHAYLALLNSETFLGLVQENAQKLLGSAWDLSKRHVSRIPLADLTGDFTGTRAVVARLADLERRSRIVEGAERVATFASIEELATELFGLGSTGLRTTGESALSMQGIDETGALWKLRRRDIDEDDQAGRVGLLENIHRLVGSGRGRIVDAQLGELDLAGISSVTIMTILRGTFSIRRDIASWATLLERATDVLRERGLNTGKLLAGLNR